MRRTPILGRTRDAIIFLALAAVITLTSSMTGGGQNQDLRLMNLERRFDQLQQRVDWLEREQRNLALQQLGQSGVSPEALAQLQRQHLSLAEQQVALRQQLLQLQKRVDQLLEHSRQKQENESPAPPQKEEPKAKPPARRPGR